MWVRSTLAQANLRGAFETTMLRLRSSLHVGWPASLLARPAGWLGASQPVLPAGQLAWSASLGGPRGQLGGKPAQPRPAGLPRLPVLTSGRDRTAPAGWQARKPANREWKRTEMFIIRPVRFGSVSSEPVPVLPVWFGLGASVGWPNLLVHG